MLSWGLSGFSNTKQHLPFIPSQHSSHKGAGDKSTTGKTLYRFVLQLKAHFGKLLFKLQSFETERQIGEKLVYSLKGKGKRAEVPELYSQEVVREHRLLYRGYFIRNINSTYSLYPNSWYFDFFFFLLTKG